jgi:hypothetical protein
MRNTTTLLNAANLASYMKEDSKHDWKNIAFEKEFRAPVFPVLRNILLNPLEELVCLDEPELFARDMVGEHGGILVLYDARCPKYQDDGVTWRKGKMSVKQILFDDGDGSYRLKNHKTDKGVSVMRRQTWIEEGDAEHGMRKHEYRLVNHEVFFQVSRTTDLCGKSLTHNLLAGE